MNSDMGSVSDPKSRYKNSVWILFVIISCGRKVPLWQSASAETQGFAVVTEPNAELRANFGKQSLVHFAVKKIAHSPNTCIEMIEYM